MRLFIAIGLDDPVKDLLCRAQRQLKRQALGGRFSRRENLHLTLAFLGEAPDIRRAAIALDQIQAAPFSLAVQGLGYFPSAKGQTWWMGTAPCPALAALHRQFAGRPAFPPSLDFGAGHPPAGRLRQPGPGPAVGRRCAAGGLHPPDGVHPPAGLALLRRAVSPAALSIIYSERG